VGTPRFLASPRRRRRLVWAGAGLAVAAVVAGIVLALPSRTKQSPEHLSSAPAYIPRVERTVPISRADHRRISALVDGFVRSAVERVEPARSYALVTPALRTGISRTQWASGSIPVAPYQAAGTSFAWTVSYSYRNRAGIVVVLHPRKGTQTSGLSANLVVRRLGGRWLVDSFVPSAVFSGHHVVGTRDFAAGSPSADGSRGRLGAAWLAVPLALVGLVVALPAFLVARGWLRSRRVERNYRRASG
jgi:hypothetical protein